MGYVPLPPPPRELFDSDEEWYRYYRAELVRARDEMPTVSSGIFLGLSILLGIFLLYFLVS